LCVACSAWTAAGYQGVEKRAPERGSTWFVAAKRGSVKAMPEGELKDAVKHAEHIWGGGLRQGKIFVVGVKQQFGYQKARFKRLLENAAQVLTLFALSDLWMARRTLLATAGEVIL
jgi:transposase, IS5 family